MTARNRTWLEPFRARSEQTAAEYGQAFVPALPRRTALNRLGQLQKMGWVVRRGQTRASVYLLTEAGAERLRSASAERHASVIEFDDRSVRIAEDPTDYLRRPYLQRKPVGYVPKFLEDYQPNRTFYLDEDERQKLQAIGSQPGLVDEAAGTYTRHICQRLLIDLSWNSSRLEGNTYSILETEQLFQTAQGGGGVLPREAVMILNHKAAIEFLLESVPMAGFDRRTILNLHALLTADLLGDPGAEGALRTAPVGIGQSTYLPLAIPARIKMHFDEILAKASAIAEPFEQAFFAMVHLPYLQPFIDGNKRVSRLAANLPLFRNRFAPLSFVDVVETDYTEAMLAVYELNEIRPLKRVFIEAYERSAQRYTVIRGAIGEPDPFRLQYREAISGVVAEIIRAGCDRPQAIVRLRGRADEMVAEKDRKKFIAAVEETLSAIHEGNFARHRVRPSEFDAWRAIWKIGGDA